MLLNIKNIRKGLRLNPHIYSDLSFLSSATRASDIKGWYKYKSIVGVIFTEIEETEINIAKAKIVQKVTECLSSVTGIYYIDDHAISFRIFPEDNGKKCTCQAPINLKRLSRNSGRGGFLVTLSRILCALMRRSYFLFIGDILLILLALVLGSGRYLGYGLNTLHYFYGNFWLAIPLYPATLYILGLYEVEGKFQAARSLLRLAVAAVLVSLALAFSFYMIPELRFGPGLPGLQMSLAFVFVTSWRFVCGYFSLRASGSVGTFIVGAGECGLAVYSFLKSQPSLFEVKGFIDDDPALQGKVMGSPAVVGTLNGLIETAEKMGVRAAILAVNRPYAPRFTRTILEARLAGMEIIELPNLYERVTRRVPVQLVEDQWLLFSDGFDLLYRESIRKIKRIMDFAVSGFLLLISFPIMIVTALAIRMDSPGPVFYRQDRIGMEGKTFKVCKFRSMTVYAETQGAQWAQKRDPRVTRIGRWIRLFRIDELPQIWNIFMGDMSLVGPRPERPEFVRDLQAAIPYYSTRHCVRPGITGWAQVNFHYGASIEDARRKLEYDLYYIKNMSILLDLKIIFRTVGVILLGDGAR